MKRSRLREIILEEIAEYSDIEGIKKRKITNPDTKKAITVGSALTYDQSEPVYTKAKQIVQKGKKIDPSPEKSVSHEKSKSTPQKKSQSSYTNHTSKTDEVGFLTADEKHYDSDAWKNGYIHKNENGSALIGTPHYNKNDGDNEEKRFIEKNVFPAVKQAVMDAKKSGKEVVFMAEGGTEPGMLYPEGSEQEMIDDYIKKIDPKAKTTTWDGEYFDQWNPEAGFWDETAKRTGLSKDEVSGAMYAFLVGQNDPPDDAMEYLKKDGMKLLRKNGYKGKFPPKEKSKDVKNLYKLAFPQDSGGKVGSNTISKYERAFNHLRQQNMLRSKEKYEKEGKAVIVVPGASHSYEVSDSWK